MKKRILSSTTAVALCLTMFPTVAESENSGLCVHHPVHTEECGYIAQTEGAHCNHVHTAECYTLGSLPDEEQADEASDLIVEPEPGSSAGEETDPGGSTDQLEETQPGGSTDQPAGEETQPRINEDSPKEVQSDADKADVPVSAESQENRLDCHHFHDETCGYQASNPGQPCGFVCDACSEQAQPDSVDESQPELSDEEIAALIAQAGEGMDLPTVLAAGTETTVGPFTITGSNILASDYTYANGLLTINTTKALKITTNSTQTTERIKVKSSVKANITLENVDIASTTDCALDFSSASASIITLSGMNKLKSGGSAPGIALPNSNGLTIKGDGSIETWGGTDAAGIGYIGKSGGSGSIAITSGTIIAHGNGTGAGIKNGNYTVSAFKITGGKVTAIGGEAGKGIDTKLLNEVTNSELTAIGGAQNCEGIYCSSGSEVSITGSIVTATGGGSGAGIANGGKITINDSTITATGGESGIGIKCDGSNSVVSVSNSTVTATGYGAGVGIKTKSLTITKNSKVEAIGGEQDGAGIQCGSSINIQNESTVTATGGGSGAGIDGDSSLTISDSTVTANGGVTGAGIDIAQSITITNGKVEAAGGEQSGVGIQCGKAYSVTIYSGTVTATGSGSDAGIDAGYIKVTDGEVNATGGEQNGAGINCVNTSNNSTISGGKVTATGGGSGSGIECSNTFTVSSGAVTATGGEQNGVGINGAVKVSGGTVIAAGKGTGAGIGSGPLNNKTFSTASPGGFVFTNSIMKPSTSAQYGLIFTGSEVELGQNFTVKGEVTIPEGYTMIIPSGKTLTITDKLINNGTIINNGTLTVNGTLTNTGTITNAGRITISQTSGTMPNSGTITNEGTLTISGTLPNTGTIANSADCTVTGMIGLGTEEEPYEVFDYPTLLAFSTYSKNNYCTGKFVSQTQDICANENVLDANGALTGANFNKWTPITTFAGTFDGNNHTVSGLYTGTSLFSAIGVNSSSGVVRNVNIEDSYFSGTANVGGIAGNVMSGSRIENCTFKGLLEGTGTQSANCVGGVCGKNTYGTITGCSNSGKITAKSTLTTSFTGGICGENGAKSIVTNCYNTGTIVAKGYAGGVCGKNSGNITGCYNSSEITAAGSNAGGICSNNNTGAAITNCYNTGAVAAKNCVGGVCGYSTATVTNCYNIGTVSGTSTGTSSIYVGGVLGSRVNNSTITNCFYLEGCAKNGKSTVQNGLGTSTTATTKDVASQTTGKTAEEFKSGEIARLLQDAQETQTPQTWGQKIPEDAHPVLTAEEAKKVCKVTFKHEDNTEEYAYANCDGTVTVPNLTDTSKKWVIEGTETDFTNNTPVTEDTTVCAVDKGTSTLQLAAKVGPHIITTTYGGEVTTDLSACVEYTDDTPNAKNRCNYTITNGSPDSNFIINGDNLTTNNTLNVGTYELTIMATDKNDSSLSATFKLTVVVNKVNQGQLDLTINYIDETLSTAASMEYLSGGSWVTCSPDMKLSVFGWTGDTDKTVSFRMKSDDNHNPGDEKNVTFKKRPDAPNSLTAVKTTASNKSDGKITGTTAAMEYKPANETDWKACSGPEITGLAPGTYEVRFRATDNEFASLIKEATIEEGKALTYILEVTKSIKFDAVPENYEQPAPQALTIENKGTGDVTISSVTINSSDFTLNKTAGTTIKAGATDSSTYEVQPKSGLDVGKYTATITVNYDNDASATVDVTFQVDYAAPKVSIDYEKETLSTTADMEYCIENETDWKACTENMSLSISPNVFGWAGTEEKKVKFRMKDNTNPNGVAEITIPARPAAPTVSLTLIKSEDKITVDNNVGNFSECEFSIDKKNWNSTGIFTELPAETEQKLQVRSKATKNSFHSLPTERTVVTTAPDGSTYLKPGETVTTWNDAAIANSGGNITIQNGGTTTSITLSNSGDVRVHGDGTVEVPGNSSVQTNGNSINVPEKGARVTTDGRVLYDVTLSFDTKGGSTVPDQILTAGEKAQKPDDPTKTNYMFDGWFQNENYDQEWDFGQFLTENRTLYAKWTERLADVLPLS